MGNTKSNFRKLSRRNSFSISLRPGSSDRGLSSDLKFRSGSEENRSSTASRSHSLASNTTGGSDISRISVPDTYNDQSSCSIKEPPATLSSEQLSLVKYSWHLVSIDTSNVCMNFFHQLQRQFTPKIKKSLLKTKNVHSSTPSLYNSGHNGNGNSYSNQQSWARNRSCTGSHSCQSGTRTLIQGQLTQQALKLACCLDAVIGSLTRNSKIQSSEKLVEMLADSGHQFKTFFGIDNFYTDNLVVREMTNAFCESLRLVLIQNGLNWSLELQEAWDTTFRILLYHLDGLSEIYDEDDMLW